MAFTLESSAFASGQTLPAPCTCDGWGVSPPLAWHGAPNSTQAFALIADDPDAPSGSFTHWVLYNLPAAIRALDAGVPHLERLPSGAPHGNNSGGQTGYYPACPPPRDQSHRSCFTRYALDIPLSLKRPASKEQVIQAVRGNLLAQATLEARYGRWGRRA